MGSWGILQLREDDCMGDKLQFQCDQGATSSGPCAQVDRAVFSGVRKVANEEVKARLPD